MTYKEVKILQEIHNIFNQHTFVNDVCTICGLAKEDVDIIYDIGFDTFTDFTLYVVDRFKLEKISKNRWKKIRNINLNIIRKYCSIINEEDFPMVERYMSWFFGLLPQSFCDWWGRSIRNTISKILK